MERDLGSSAVNVPVIAGTFLLQLNGEKRKRKFKTCLPVEIEAITVAWSAAAFLSLRSIPRRRFTWVAPRKTNKTLTFVLYGWKRYACLDMIAFNS